MARIRLDRHLADDSTLLLVGQVEGAPNCRVLRADIASPGAGALSFVEAPVAADGGFRLAMPLGPLTAIELAARPCQAPFRLSIRCAADPAGPAWPEPGKPGILELRCRPELTLGEATVDGSCVDGDGPALRVLRPPITVARHDRLGDILVGVEVLTGSVVRERKILVCRGEEARYDLATAFRIPGGTTVSWRAGLLETDAEAPLTAAQTTAPVALKACPVPPPKEDPAWQAPGWCARLPLSCAELLVLWRSLLLAGLAALYVSLALAPPDWGLRVGAYLIGQGVSSAVAKGTQTGAASVAGTAGTPSGSVGAGLGSTAGGALTEAQRQTLDAIIGLVDGFVVLAGFIASAFGGFCLIVGLVALLLWWLCCGRSSRCAIWTQLAWVLEAAIAVVLPITGTVAAVIGAAVAGLGGPAAAGRAATAFFLQLAGGLLIGTLLYGFVRWRRDVNQCPVRPLWRRPWVE